MASLAAAAAAAAALAAPRRVAADGEELKWHPGHYMLVYLGDTQAQRLRHFDEIANEDVLEGAQVRYRWVDLEPRKDVYDFSAIEKDLQRLQSHGKRLVIQIMDRGFGTKTPAGIVPEYLTQEPEYHGGLAKSATGFVARLWEPAVMDREIALYRALARRFDGEPYLEGVASEETTPGFGKNRPPDFSNDLLDQQLRRWMAANRAAWPRTNLFVYTNFLQGKLQGIIAQCAIDGCGVGGPDVLPGGDGTEGDRVLTGRSGGVDYRGRVPVAYGVQTPALGGKEGTFTPQQLFDHAYGTLHANYIFWIRNTTTGGPPQRWDTGILPFIRSIDGKINTTCPRSVEARCKPPPPRRGALDSGAERGAHGARNEERSPPAPETPQQGELRQ
jgi:hypothetical protein